MKSRTQPIDRNPKAVTRVSFGRVPLVVGVIGSKPGSLSRRPTSDLVELRVDLMKRDADWREWAAAFERIGCPVIVTIRHHSEGGLWRGDDASRFDLYRQAIDAASVVDVEFKSRIARKVAQLAHRCGKQCILSFHDFDKTPPLHSLLRVVRAAQRTASVVKVTTLVRSDKDVSVLRGLLVRRWKVPLCVMGMGPLGVGVRVELAAMGSCLVYGYLDRPVAPGQQSALAVFRKLKSRLPRYREYRRRRQRAAR